MRKGLPNNYCEEEVLWTDSDTNTEYEINASFLWEDAEPDVGIMHGGWICESWECDGMDNEMYLAHYDLILAHCEESKTIEEYENDD